MKNLSIKVLSLCLIFLSSCLSTSKITQKKNSIIIDPKPLAVKKIVPATWKVGKNQRTELHKGFKIEFTLPRISKSDLKEIYQKYKANSLLIDIKKYQSGRWMSVGKMAVPFINRKIGLSKKAWAQVNYYSAEIRPSHVLYICPPYGHDLIITDFDIKKRKRYESSLNLSVANEKKVGAKVRNFSFNVQSYNGGKNLAGTYKASMAFYNTSSKMLASNYVDFPEHIFIEREKSTQVKGCETYTGDGILKHKKKKFNWNRKN